MNFKIDICPCCNQKKELMFSNNPLNFAPLCFDCLSQMLDSKNLEKADFFCRTYNLPFNPELWITLEQQYGKDVFKQYTQIVLEDKELQPNLYYQSTTKDL